MESVCGISHQTDQHHRPVHRCIVDHVCGADTSRSKACQVIGGSCEGDDGERKNESEASRGTHVGFVGRNVLIEILNLGVTSTKSADRGRGCWVVRGVV